MLLKQSTARNRVILMVQTSDHITGLAGLTLTITASKDGAAFASITPTVTDRGNGFYSLALDTTHTNTLGDFALHITGAAADPTDVVDQIVVELPGGASASNVTQIMGTSITEGAAGRLAAAFSALLNVAAPVFTVASVNQTGDAFVRLGAPVGASISADVAGVQSDTNDIQTRLPAALVSGRIDASVGAYPGNTAQTGDSYVRLGAPVGASISADIAAVSTLVSAVPTAVQNADALLVRDLTAVAAPATRSVFNALRFLRNKWAVVAGVLTVYKEDDTTSAWSANVTSSASADPITASDPT